ncbi:MAG: undecaprenyl-phosphate glucose phosphotransferase [Ignavibacteriales bacterium]|nr:undecaprenyl-phosphate glucose phosphotransferase [Ignavibacteriales bacterium]
MSKRKEILFLFVLDSIAINGAYAVYYWFRFYSGVFPVVFEPELLMPMAAMNIYWTLLFFFFGFYRSWYRQSRLDELSLLFKATSFGILLLFFLVFIDDQGVGSPTMSRLYILAYWAILLFSVSSGRLAIHTFQRRMLIAGVGRRKAVIIGISEKAKELYSHVKKYPELGLEMVGFVSLEELNFEKGTNDFQIIGALNSFSTIVEKHAIKEVLIALDSTQHDKLLEVIAQCNSHDVELKIIPDLYDIISGQARTMPLHGFPLIEIMPEIMQPWEKFLKRLLDICFSLFSLIFILPLWIIVAILIKVTSKGTILYSQERVGKDGKHFRIYKFRTMYDDAEKQSGPVWAGKDDPRITKIGNILRKTRIDEIPQLINVLDGDMSLVGPRPERPYFVEQLSRDIPLYSRRLKVRPGITGWAQVKHKYDESIEDVKKKVEYDLYYIENMSLRLDIKILLKTVSVVLLGKGH